jgi:hypothetical protein
MSLLARRKFIIILHNLRKKTLMLVFLGLHETMTEPPDLSSSFSFFPSLVEDDNELASSSLFLFFLPDL